MLQHWTVTVAPRPVPAGAAMEPATFCGPAATGAPPRRPARSVQLAVVAIGLWCGATGCGYRHQAIFPDDVATVAVPIFTNRSFYQGVQFDLTEAIKKQIEWRTPYKVVNRARADTILTGQIVRITQSVLSRRRQGGLPQDVEYQMMVNFEWKDLRTGRILRQQSGRLIAAAYGPARQIGESQALGRQRMVVRVAEKVVSAMKAEL